MAIQPGNRLPDVMINVMDAGHPRPVSSLALMGTGRVVVFAVPGAFTPTCSVHHLPGFISRAEALRDRGVNRIVCLAVNDIFVMDAWAKASGVDNRITMAADGNGEFTRALGLEMDATGFGMGMRAQRFAMVIDDGVVRRLFVEAPGEFKVSSAEYVLRNLPD